MTLKHHFPECNTRKQANKCERKRNHPVTPCHPSEGWEFKKETKRCKLRLQRGIGVPRPSNTMKLKHHFPPEYKPKCERKKTTSSAVAATPPAEENEELPHRFQRHPFREGELRKEMLNALIICIFEMY